MAYYIPRFGEPSPGNAALQGEAYGSSAPPRFWTPGFMIAAIALLAAWWLRKH